MTHLLTRLVQKLPGQGVLSGLGDLVLAGLFAAWVPGRRGAA